MEELKHAMTSLPIYLLASLLHSYRLDYNDMSMVNLLFSLVAITALSIIHVPVARTTE